MSDKEGVPQAKQCTGLSKNMCSSGALSQQCIWDPSGSRGGSCIFTGGNGFDSGPHNTSSDHLPGFFMSELQDLTKGASVPLERQGKQPPMTGTCKSLCSANGLTVAPDAKPGDSVYDCKCIAKMAGGLVYASDQGSLRQ
tara:strand:- start:1607 stop:2026 length:420 start_codon:yes stop_codon:yes gene_type:complete